MTLKIVKAEEAITVERINVCIYGQPGLGKTTLAFTADSPLVLDFDKGAYRACNRKDTVVVSSWADVVAITQDDLEPYKTIVVDTAGRALDFLTADIIKNDAKAGKGGALTLQGFGKLKVQFSAWLKLLNSFGKDVVLIAHMDEQKNGDDIIERLDVQGSSKGEIYKSVDAMGRIFVKGGKRVLDFSPREGSFGKNPGQYPELDIPHPAANPYFLSEVIGGIKAKLNELTEEQAKQQQSITEWAEKVKALDTVEKFNEQIPAVKHAPQAAKAIFNKAAHDLGLTFNKATNRYEEQAVVA